MTKKGTFMDIQKKIEELGLFLPACPKPLASYVPANRIDNLIYVSGQLPSIKGDLGSYVGSVPSSMSPEVAARAAGLCLLNSIAAAISVLQPGETLKLVQMQGFIQSDPDFHEQAAILNGASNLAVKIFERNGYHARTAVGVSSLPKNAVVELSCIFQVIADESKFTGRNDWLL